MVVIFEPRRERGKGRGGGGVLHVCGAAKDVMYMVQWAGGALCRPGARTPQDTLLPAPPGFLSLMQPATKRTNYTPYTHVRATLIQVSNQHMHTLRNHFLIHIPGLCYSNNKLGMCMI